MDTLRTFDDIDVKLVGAIAPPYEIAVASARTCYSGRGIILPEEVSKDDRARELRDKIASSTLEAGHLTTRQHAHFVFAISGISRQCIWSFLHSHPFYNSEQVSQRYVRVKRGNFVVPPLSEAQRKIYLTAIDAQMQAYENLIHALREPLSVDFYERFKARKKTPEKWQSAIDKRAFEVARYVLGVGTTAYLYHTVSALTLLRYAKLVELFETPQEQKVLVGKMLALVKAADPLFEKDLVDAIPLEKTLEYSLFVKFQSEQSGNPKDFIREFDASLDGKISKLVSYTHDAESVLAHSVRVSLGKLPRELSDAEALGYLLDPAKNPILSDTLNVSTIDRYSQLLHHVHLTFQKKLSHAADSQDQRHRTVLSSRPTLLFHYSGEPDYVTPFGITQSQRATDLYMRIMDLTFSSINQLLDDGVKPEYAFYLLPNAFSVRMVSSGDLQSYQHKWKLRSCYNAQEEIFRATIDEIRQVKELFPRIGEHLKAPCYLRLRAGVRPHCPEGERFCGIPVWKFDINQYQRKSL